MRYITGIATVALALTLSACSSSSGGSTGATTAFVTSTRAAWQPASLVSTSSMGGETRAATAWRGFAITVQGMDAGKDRAAQGQLVALANEAADAYTADVAAFECGIRATIEPGAAACPPKPATAPDVFVVQIQQMVQGL